MEKEKMIYEKPDIEIIAYELEGVIAASGQSNDLVFGAGMDDTPDGPASGSFWESGW